MRPQSPATTLARACIVCALGLPVSNAFAYPAPRTSQQEGRFAMADVNGDGQLTRAEIAARLPLLSSHYDAIDVYGVGYVTAPQIHDYLRQHEKARPDEPPGFVLYRW